MRRTRLGLLIVVVVVVAAGWIAFRGLPWRESDGEQAKAVIEPFTQALRQRDFGRACALVAETAPPKGSGAAACPSRLRDGHVRELSVLLRTVEVNEDGRENGRVYIAAFEPGGLFDLGPVVHFTFVREDGSLRIEHVAGFF